MNIGLVGHKLLIDDPAGVEKYIYQIFNALAQIDKENKYTVYVTKEPKKEFWDKLSHHNPNFNYKVIKKSNNPLGSWVQISLANELHKNPQDVVFYPIDTISGLLNIFKKDKFNAVCMIHDLGYVESKEYRNPIHRMLHHYTIEYVIKKSRKLIVPSYAVKDKILEKYPVIGKQICQQDKIVVIPEGLNDNFLDSDEITPKQVKNVRDKYKLNNHDYLYFVSTIQPRKNIPLMIEAFSEVIKENPNYRAVLLVMSGKLGWNYEKSLNAPCKYGIKDHVRFIERTPDEEIPMLMRGATGFINVSLEEGFGLPVLEAMACETPMIISNIGVYKEVASDNAIYVNPKSKDSIKTGILELLCGTSQTERVKQAKKLSKQFTWKETAKKTLEVFKSALP